MAEGEGEVVKSPSAHPSDLRRQWAEKQLWATHSPLLQPCPMGPRHTYTNTVRHYHRMWTCRCTPNTCTLQRFLFPQTHLHTLRLYNKKEIYKLWITFTNSSLENISRDVIGRRGTVNGKPKEMFKFYVLFGYLVWQISQWGFNQGQSIQQTSPQSWLSLAPVNWGTKLVGCLGHPMLAPLCHRFHLKSLILTNVLRKMWYSLFNRNHNFYLNKQLYREN